MSAPGRGLSLLEGWHLSRLTAFELWLFYFAIGGDAGGAELSAYVRGALHPDCYQHNLIARALNECLAGADGCPLVSYRQPDSR